ncbi:MAG TPA: hypothetical protein DCE14_06390 [Kosmotogaceae bacterium]|nr:MAG: Uncharacterized protein XE05_0236 [Thermotogales bacterium 46_20]HAA85956.1 hypothetical protein [Kosmotogaceae bacterium]
MIRPWLSLLIVFLALSSGLSSGLEADFRVHNLDWTARMALPFYERFSLSLRMSADDAQLGITYSDAWDEYTRGFLRIKTREGRFHGGLSLGEKGVSLYAKYSSSIFTPPVFSHTYFESEVSSDGDYSLYMRSWFRVPLGNLNGGAHVLGYVSPTFGFMDAGTYLYANEFERSFRLRVAGPVAMATVDISTQDSLGEVGYGIGVGMNYRSFKLGIAMSGNMVVSLNGFKIVVSPAICVRLDTVESQFMITKLGTDNTFSFGLGMDGLKITSFFLRLSVQ